jgi:glycosyltransferase involved in cell wall biosynthesis
VKPGATRSGGRAPRTLLIAVHSAAPGGAQAMALIEAERFSERCAIVAAVPGGPLRPRFAACAELIEPPPSLPTWPASPLRWALQLGRSCLDAIRLAREIRRRRVDAVLTSSSVLVAPVLAARLAGVPALAYVREWPTSRKGMAVLWLQRHLAEVVVAISDGVAARLPAHGRARVVRIPDGIAIPRESPRPAPFTAPLRLCTIGSLTGGDGKGQHRAVEALALLGERGVEATLSVVGPILDDSYAERVRETARECGVAERVHLTGAVDDVPALLREHDALLFCSGHGADVTPLVLMEALVEERAVVAADVGSVAEVVPDGECGSIVPPANPAAMAAAVAALVADPEAARAQAARGGERVRREYDRERGLERLWEEILTAVDDAGRSEVPSSSTRFKDGRTRDAIAHVDG